PTSFALTATATTQISPLSLHDALPILTASAQSGGEAERELDRTILPIPEPTPPKYTELDVRQTKPPARFQVKAPQGAPNVIIILDRKSTRLNSSHVKISYAVFCLKKKR